MNRATIAIALAALIALVAFSEHLAFNRIFQVDELQNVFMARRIAAGEVANYEASVPLMLHGPMAWIAGSIDRAALLLRAERTFFFCLFWVNLCLIVRAAGMRLRSVEGLVALLFVATLAPLWDHGFEIRHDNGVLLCLLLAWIAARQRGRWRLFAIGMLCALAQFLAIKAFVYTLPIAAYALFARDRRLRGAGELALGVLAAIAAGLAIHWFGGTWSVYVNDLRALGSGAVHVERFSPMVTLSRLVFHTPVLLVAMGFAAVRAFRRDRSLLPELGWFALAFIALLVNPTPFPYNLLLLVPQMAILCIRAFRDAPKTVLIAAFIVNALCWIYATSRHIPMTNARQMELATLAEEMTDADRECVLDGAGLVPTRRPSGRHWLINIFTIEALREGKVPTVRAQLAEGRTPVIIPNYRVLALPREDLQFIHEHYIPLAGDFYVAGTLLQRGRTEWDVLVPGRYALGDAVITLRKGRQGFRLNENTPLIWLGPHLRMPPDPGPGDPRELLVTWY